MPKSTYDRAIDRKPGAGGSTTVISSGAASAIVHSTLLGLAADDHTQYLKADGTRPLTGNLSVADTITIDGVDLSAHVLLPNVHHNQAHVLATNVALGGDHTVSGATAGHVLRASGATTALFDQLQHADLGGVTSDQHHAQLHAMLDTAHHSYSGGAAYDVFGLSAASTLAKLTPSYDVSGGGTALLRSNAGALGVATLNSTVNLTLQPTGDLVLDPVGNDVLPATNYDINLGMLSKKYLTLHAAELWVETLVAQNTIATIGGRVLIGPTTTLTRDLSDVATTVYVKHNQMASGDRVYMEADGKVEFFAITSGASAESDGYSYTVTRNLDGTGANLWYAGDAMFNTGTTGDGWIDLYSIGSMKPGAAQYGPTIVGNVRTSATFNDWGEAWAIGNLNGLYGYGADTYGVGLGQYASGKANITIDPTNGFRLRSYTTDILQIKNSDGKAYIVGPLQLDTAGGIYQGSGTFASPTTGLKIWNDSGFGRIGGYNASTLEWSAGTDGLLYAGGTVIGQHGIRFDNDLALGIYDLAWEDGGTSHGYIRGSYDLNDWLGLQIYSADLGIFITGATTITGNLTMADTYLISTDAIRARDSSGLALADDSGNLGVFVEDGGFVGIGTNNPSAALHIVSGESRATLKIERGEGSGNGSSEIKFGTLNPWEVGMDFAASGNNDFYIYRTGATPYFYIDSGGDVGIGTDSPASGMKLHVVGDTYNDGDLTVTGDFGGAWNTLSLTSPWTTYDNTNWGEVRYRKVGDLVFLEGMPARPSGYSSSVAIATLPTGYRPGKKATYVVNVDVAGSWQAGRIDVRADGVIDLIVPSTSATVTWVSFGGVCFSTTAQ